MVGILQSPQFIALVIFLGAYVFLSTHKANPVLVVWTGVGALLALKVITFGDAVRALNFNVIGILIGMMVLSELFIASEAPGFLASKVVDRSKTVSGAVLAISFLAGGISAFVENVATVLIVAPVALAIADKLKISPIPFLTGIAVSANLQGAATMVGDSPSIILAMAAKMNFTDFFWMKGKPGIFFAVELGALASAFVLYRAFRRYNQPVAQVEEIPVKTWVPAAFLILMIFSLAVSSFIQDKPPYTVGAIGAAYALLAFVWHEIHRGEIHVPRLLTRLDWTTFFLLAGLFILVGSFSVVGLVDAIARGISKITGQNVFMAYTTIVWLSVLISAFVDNIPYTIAMIPVTQRVAADLGIPPYLFMFGLLIGASLGGNITPIGASANVVAMGLLRKNGHRPSFTDFTRIGLPFTLVAVGSAYLLLWIVWHP